MRTSIRTVGKVCLFVFVLSAPVLAENQLASGAPPAVTGPAYDVSVGYANLIMALPGAGHVNLNGVDGNGSVILSSHWGAMVDSSYLRTSQILFTPHSGYVLSFHAGPVFYPAERGNTRVFLRALAGAGMVDGATPASQTEYVHGWLVRPSYVAGGGVEHFLSGRFGIRVSADYLRTSFFDSAVAARPQNNLRLIVGFVFHLQEHEHRANTRSRQ